MDDESRTTAIGLARYAADFLEAALATDDVMGKDAKYSIIAPVPALYLIGHSIELYLKSYLRHEGRSKNNLRKIGHDLNKCLKRSKELGILDLITFESGELEAFSVLHELYCSKQLNYIETGSKTFPIFGPLETMAKKLDGAISPYVGYKSRFSA